MSGRKCTNSFVSKRMHNSLFVWLDNDPPNHIALDGTAATLLLFLLTLGHSACMQDRRA